MTSYPYYLQAPPYIATSAGIRVLYGLVHALNEAGHEAWIVMEPYMPSAYTVPNELNAPLLTLDVIQRHRNENRPPIAIYSEVVDGNPLGASAVVRYVMNEPGLLGGPRAFPGEQLFGYGAVISKSLGVPNNNLFLPAIDLKDFPPPLHKPRKEVLIYAAKFRAVHGMEPFGAPKGALEFNRDTDGSPDPLTVRNLLQKADRIYLYENTALAIEAPLSGCVAVMMPNPYLSYPIGVLDHGNGGIAWGDSDSEIARARSTIAEMRTGYQSAIDRVPEQLSGFIVQTQEFGSTPRPFLLHNRGLRLSPYTYDKAASDAAIRMLRSGHLVQLPRKLASVLKRHGAKIVARIVASFVKKQLVRMYHRR